RAGTREWRASCSISGISRHRQKSSVNAPGSLAELATWASGPGRASTASIAAAATATSPGSSTERRQATPSPAKAATASSSGRTGSISGTVALATLMPEGGPLRGRLSVARGIQVGDKAPDFTLPSQTGEHFRLQDRLGERVVVLYFYPKDNT